MLIPLEKNVEKVRQLWIGRQNNMHTRYNWNSEEAESNTYDYKMIRHYLSKEKNTLILDVGCGNGNISNKLIKEGYNVYGIDSSESGIECANCENHNRFFVMDFETDDLPSTISMSGQVDTIISCQVIEHIYSPQTLIKRMNEILPQNGMVIITTPYHGYIKNLALSLLGKMDGHFTALWEGGHIKFWSRKTLTQLLERNGFRVIGFKGGGRIPYLWKSMLLVAVKC